MDFATQKVLNQSICGCRLLSKLKNELSCRRPVFGSSGRNDITLAISLCLSGF